jgi:hypothetical protein
MLRCEKCASRARCLSGGTRQTQRNFLFLRHLCLKLWPFGLARPLGCKCCDAKTIPQRPILSQRKDAQKSGRAGNRAGTFGINQGTMFQEVLLR